MGLGLKEVYEFGLLGDGSLHFPLLVRVHRLQVELSEHHYCHEFILKYFTPNVMEGWRDGWKQREVACREVKSVRGEKNETGNKTWIYI